MNIDGGCLCGAVKWRANINPNMVGICHCTQCQINSASAFQWTALVPAEDFELLSGQLKAYVKTSESGNKRALSFCPDCGTTIHGSDVEATKAYSLRFGNCRQREQLEPKFQLWCRSAMPWTKNLDVGTKIEEQIGFR